MIRRLVGPERLNAWIASLAAVVLMSSLPASWDDAAAEPGGGAPVSESIFDLFVLGMAQDGGVPHVGCMRQCCVTARKENKRFFPASLGIRDRGTGATLLIEATPQIEAQLALFYRVAGIDSLPRGNPVDAVMITHAHIGHYLGLAQFGREVAATHDIPVYGTPRMAEFLTGNGPWSQLVELHQIRPVAVEPGTPFEPIPGLKVTAIRVPHRDEFTDCVAFRIEGPANTVLFCPDVDRWDAEPGLLERLLDGVDFAYLDGTFYDGRELPGRDLSEIPHPLMTDTMDRLAAFASKHPNCVRFIHMNHTNPVLWDSTTRALLKPRGFQIALQGSLARI